MEWPPAWRAGRAGRAVFLGIVWGKCIVRASLEQAARASAAGLWGVPPASPKCCFWGRELGLGQSLGGRGWDFPGEAAGGGASSHSADQETEAQREHWPDEMCTGM